MISADIYLALDGVLSVDSVTVGNRPAQALLPNCTITEIATGQPDLTTGIDYTTEESFRVAIRATTRASAESLRESADDLVHGVTSTTGSGRLMEILRDAGAVIQDPDDVWLAYYDYTAIIQDALARA